MSKLAARRAGKSPARGPARRSRRNNRDEEWQREMLELWLHTSLKLRQLAGDPDVGAHDTPPPARNRRLGGRAA